MAEDEKPEQEEKEKKPAKLEHTGQPDKGKWADIIKAVNSPLTLFVVPALCFESATVAALLTLPEIHFKFAAFVVGQFCTLIELVIVSYITIHHADKWSPEMAKALEKSEQAISGIQDIQHFLNSQAFKDAVIDTIEGDKSPNTATKMLRPGENENE